MSSSLCPYVPQPVRLLCSWDSPGKNAGVGYHALLQGIFPTQGWNQGLLRRRQILYQLSHQEHWGVHACLHAKSLEVCLTRCDPMDCSPPGSSVHGILQARILEWVAVPSSRGSSQPRESNPCLLGFLHWQVDSLPLAPPDSLIHPLLVVL